MAYKYVTRQDLVGTLRTLQSKGLHGSDLAAAVQQQADQLEFQRSKASGPPLLIKAMGIGLTDMLADTMKGTELLTGLPTGWLGDAVREQGAFGIKALTDTLSRQQVAEAQAQPVLTGEHIAASAGQMIPFLASLSLTGGAVGALSKGLGLAAKTAAMAQKLAGVPQLLANEVGRLHESERAMGIDDDVARRKAYVGGALNTLAMSAHVAPILKTLMRTGQPVTGGVLKALGKTALGLGQMTGAGAAMAAIGNQSIESGIEEMQERHGPNWQPPDTYEPTDIGKAAASALVTGGILQAGGRIAGIPIRFLKDREAVISLREEMSKNIHGMVEQGIPLERAMGIVRTKLSMKPAGWNAKMKEAAAGIEGEALSSALDKLDFDALRTLYKQQGLGDTKGLTTTDMKADIIGKSGAIKEGPRWRWKTLKGKEVPGQQRGPTRKTVAFDPVFLDKTPADELEFGRNVDLIARQFLRNKWGDDKLQMAKEVMYWRKKALISAGLPEKMAMRPELNDPKLFNKSDAAIRTKLTRAQHTKYMLRMKAQLRGAMRLAAGTRSAKDAAANLLDSKLFLSQEAPPFETYTDKVTGKVIDAITEKFPRIGTMLSNIRPFLFQLTDAQNKTGIPFLRFDYVMFQRHAQMLGRLHGLTAYRESFWKNLPSELRRGAGRRTFNDMVYFTMSGKDIRNMLAKQYGTKQYRKMYSEKGAKGEGIGVTPLEFARRVIEASRSKLTPEQVVKYAEGVAGKHRALFNWLFEATGMDPSRFLENYAPLVYEFTSTVKERNDITFGEWLKVNREKLSEKFGLSEEDFGSMEDMGDTLMYLRKRNMVDVGKTPFYEFTRRMDLDSLKEIGDAYINTDIERLTDRYIRTMMRKIYFDDLAPTVDAFMQKIRTTLTSRGIRSELMEMQFSNYLESVFGMESPVSRAYKDLNFRSGMGAVSSTLNWFAKHWDKHFGQWVEFPKKFGPHEITSNLTTGLFAAQLGMPFGWKSPFKNIASQNVMAALTGIPDYIKAMYKLTDPEYIKQLKAMDLRPEFPAPDWEASAGRGHIAQLAQELLSIYTKSDYVNVYTSAAVADVIWERLENYMKTDPKLERITVDDFSRLLFKHKQPKDIGLREGEVLQHNMKMADMYKWNKAPKAFRGLSMELYDMVKAGDVKNARKMLMQYMVNISQWRYGAGGSPAFLRNALLRPFFMYATWPLNYLEYLKLFGPGSGMFKENLQLHAAQILVMSLLAGLGLQTHKWVLGGALMDEIGPTGPIVDTLNELIKVIRTGSEAALSEILPVDEEAEKKSQSAFKNAIKIY
ncbi:MAG: hypothetical protein WC822_01585 [Candidatus Paceibacterota bacterium]|jgi:hypothetical protein